MSPAPRPRVDPDTVWPLHEVARRLSARLEEDWPPFWVAGEISGLKRHAASGHHYFTLKDEHAQFAAVMWRGKLGAGVPPREGQRVEARVRMVFYPPQGRLQLDVQELRAGGQGDLMRAFLELRDRLAAEGLFDNARKRPLPAFPTDIGLLTSESGAALQDLLNGFRRRWPSVRCHLLPVPVQGPGAGPALAGGLARLASWPGLRLDLIVLGRGGGSFEDLYCFNDEALVRAVAACPVPVVSAVGHEIDTTLSDLAADLRAATPTAAAELCVPDRAALAGRLESDRRRLEQAQRQRLGQARGRLAAAVTHRALADPPRRLREAAQRLDEAQESLRLALSERALRERGACEDAARRLRAVLARLGGRCEERLSGLPRRLAACMERTCREHASREGRLAGQLAPLMDARLREARLRLDGWGQRLRQREAGRLEQAAFQLGFARVLRRGEPVAAAAELAAGDKLELHFRDGRAAVRVEPEERETT